MNSAASTNAALNGQGTQQQGWLRRFFVREDPIYDRYAASGKARTPATKLFYLLMHLLPGIVAYIVINVGSVYRAELRYTGISGRNLQYGWLILITFGWHMVVPMLFLRFDG